LKEIINSSTVDSNQASRGDAVDYLLTFDIGNSQNMKSLVLSDDLENVLDLKNVVIIDSDGNNVTNEGKLVTSDEDESFTWTANDPAKFSRKKLYVAIASNIKPNADVSSYDNSGIPNTGHMQINGQDTPTNVVHTTLNGDPKNPEDPKKDKPNDPSKPDGKTPDPYGNLVTKQVKAESGQWGESDKVQEDKDFDYKVEYTVGDKQDVKSVEFSDDLEDVLDLEKVTITDADGNDVTSQGELTLDKNTEKFSWKPKADLVGKMGGKKFTANITAKLKKDSKVNGEVPNTADMTVNGKDVKSNTVNVISPQADKKSPSNVNNPKNPTNSTENPNNPNNPGTNNPGSNNPITGKNGFLPRTGHFMMQHAGWFIAALVAIAGGIGSYLYKTNDDFKEKITGIKNKLIKK
jgi:fimbrial isopeptide formation D2 family protein